MSLGVVCVIRYKDNVIERICAADWPPSVVVRMAKTLQDVEMSAARLRSVVAKVLAQIGVLALEELPSLVYQLLLLSSRGEHTVFVAARRQHLTPSGVTGHRTDVLRGIMREFDALDEECPVNEDDSDDEALNLSQDRDRHDRRKGKGKGKGGRGRHAQRTSDQLRRVEGTVLSHFNFAAKQDLTLGRDMVRRDVGSPRASC